MYDCAVVDHYLHSKTPWFKYCIRISHAAKRTYFKWSDFATILKTSVASDVVFYTFYHKLHHYDDGWWIVVKHINHITIDYDMDFEEHVKIYKANMEARKRFLIESDLEYTPDLDINHMEETKKRKFKL